MYGYVQVWVYVLLCSSSMCDSLNAEHIESNVIDFALLLYLSHFVRVLRRTCGWSAVVMVVSQSQ